MSVICKYCNKLFTLQSNLNRHLKNVHNRTETNIICYEYNIHSNKCLEGCHASFINIMQLRQHFTQAHKIDFEEKTLNFGNIEGVYIVFFILFSFVNSYILFLEFENWLLELTKINNVRYVKQKTKKLMQWILLIPLNK
ncbi:unnamed protein product [Psylliodes chrysocephalus]|uniref:C2H2-type domain-containing protein n=1 Tax=Psylliodes chrysocephalus TaxID=3402493 RepID=A0A9P0CLL9_9CUCU|nr:unnamed protein product [Psylliodes chrysocephala]